MKIVLLILSMFFQSAPKQVNLYEQIKTYQIKNAALIKRIDSIKKQQSVIIKKYKKQKK